VDGSNSAVSSAYTRSVILELPMLIPGRTDMCSKIQSIATQNSVGARMHSCLTPDVVRNRPDNLDHIRTRTPVDWWRASISWITMSGMPLMCSAFQSAMLSTESNGALMSSYIALEIKKLKFKFLQIFSRYGKKCKQIVL